MVPGEPRGLGRRDGEPVRSFGGAHRVGDARPEPTPEYFRKLLGRKLSLRYSLRDVSGYSSTEAIGVLMSVTDDDRISIVDRRGNTRTIAISDIQAAKVFPI